MIDQREVRHLIRQNKKIKEKIAEQARVYKEEKQKLKYINCSLQKTLEDEKQKNQATIEEFNAQIIALEAELRRVKSNEPAVTTYTTPSSRPIKQISFVQLEAESRRLAEETNRIIQQSQKPSPSLFASSTLSTSNSTYQPSKFSNIQNYRTRYQFNIPDNYINSNGFNLTSQQQQFKQQHHEQFKQQQQEQFQQQQQEQFQQQQYQQQQQMQKQFQYNYSKTQPPTKAQDNVTQRQENQNSNQMNQEILQKNSNAPNHQLNSNTLPISSNQQSADLLDQIVEEEEENTDSDHNEQKIDASSNSLTDNIISADENPTTTMKSSANDNIHKDDQNDKTTSQQTISQNSSKSLSGSVSQSSSKTSFNTPKPSPQKTIPVKNQKDVPNSSQSQNVTSNNEKSQQQNKINQKAATSPGMAVIINDDTQNSDDPFADNFLNEEEFPEETSKQSDHQENQPKQQQKQQEAPLSKQEAPQQEKQQKQNSQQPKKSPKKDSFMNENLSGIFDDISFNHDASGFDLDMEAAFDAASQSKSIDKKDDNNTKAKNNDKNKDTKQSGKQENKKNDKQDDPDDLHVPSAGSWSFPSSQIQIDFDN